MKLGDVGKEVILDNLRGKPKVKVVMGIKAPGGKCFLFGCKSRWLDTQCKAIKAFMEQHNG
jgi:hypothetical protein